jgi:4-hydroxy-tetrahydrodipicolinate synthase
VVKLSNYYIESGASGLFANCLSSEMYELSNLERLNLIKIIVERTEGIVPVVATGTFAGTVEEQADFVKRVYDLGVKAVIVITSLLAAEDATENEFYQNVLKLLKLTDNIPLGFYECPVPYKRVISPKHLGDFVATGRITYHKDTSLNIDMIREKISETEGHAFGLYDAYMGHAVSSLKAGAAGLSCIQGNFFPELVVWLCRHYDDVDLKTEVDLAQQFFSENMETVHQVYPIIAKYYLQKRGVDISTFTRRNDYGAFDEKIMLRMDKLADNYDILKERLDLKLATV